MKRNAIIRIILWSIVIAILTTIMLGVGFGISLNRRPSATESILAVTTPPEASIAPYESNAVVTADAVNVRQAPTKTAAVAGAVYENQRLMVTRTETVDNIRWAYVTAPFVGWIVADYIELDPDSVVGGTSQDVEIPQIEETMVSGDSDGKDTFEASSIRELEIE